MKRKQSDFEDPTDRTAAFRRRPEQPTSSSAPAQKTDAFRTLMQTPASRQVELAREASVLIQSPLTINDRQSKFIAHVAQITSRRDLDAVTASVRLHPLLKTATHNIRAWRYLNLRPGKVGDSEDDFVIMEEFDDDGEKLAGGKLLRLMQASGACDCMVIVTRWYGGEMLGPVRQAISALSALYTGGFINRPPGLDPALHPFKPAENYSKYIESQPPPAPAEPEPDPRVEKTIRLLRAREGTIEAIKAQIQKLKLTQYNNQKTIRTLRNTRQDDLKLVPPPAPSPLKGPPPASAFVGKNLEELEAELKELDNKITNLRSEQGALKETISAQEKRIEELSFVVAKIGFDD
ncbi:hypothetical protein HDU97_002225 [Phlyctochytrium planicorne]|nr:hypothetical protein HDU97_002225 [Phlyctochytrium planicorne]